MKDKSIKFDFINLRDILIFLLAEGQYLVIKEVWWYLAVTFIIEIY